MYNRVKILIEDNFLYNLSIDIWMALILPGNIFVGDKVFAVTFLLIFQMKFAGGESSPQISYFIVNNAEMTMIAHKFVCTFITC